MISFLQGKAVATDTVLVGGVGYQVSTACGLSVGEDVELWVHTCVRENDISLFGFVSPGERALFVALTKVPGVGPALAVKVLSLGAGVVAKAVTGGDTKALTKAAGVGPRVAQQIVTSVKVPESVLEALAGEVTPADPLVGVYDALVGLGFEVGAARAAVAQVLEADGSLPHPVVLRKAIAVLGARRAA